MKHLFHKRHHHHLKKRALLEFIGLIVLVAISYSQRGVLREAVGTVSQIHAWWLAVILGMFWLILPLTAFSYKQITPKPDKLRIRTTILAHLAGAGPGRIIPGGIGNLSIGAVHLKKTGLSIEQAVSVVITNNLFGLLTSISLVLIAIIARPETLVLLGGELSSGHILISVLAITAFAVIIQWLMHARSTHKEIVKALRQWRQVLRHFLHYPSKVLSVVCISLIITAVSTLMLYLSAVAVGSTVTLLDALFALSFGIAIGSIFPTPGGIGGVEAGIIATLIVLGYDGTTATSIAVLFRVATYWQPLLPGTLSYLYLRERKLL
jgi:glycosyltransferase 2 family protein